MEQEQRAWLYCQSRDPHPESRLDGLSRSQRRKSGREIWRRCGSAPRRRLPQRFDIVSIHCASSARRAQTLLSHCSFCSKVVHGGCYIHMLRSLRMAAETAAKRARTSGPLLIGTHKYVRALAACVILTTNSAHAVAISTQMKHWLSTCSVSFRRTPAPLSFAPEILLYLPNAIP